MSSRLDSITMHFDRGFLNDMNSVHLGQIRKGYESGTVDYLNF